MSVDYRDTLPESQSLATELLAAVRELEQSDLVLHAPVIDPEGSFAWQQHEVAGWNKMVQAVERLAATVDELVRSNAPVGEDPLPSLQSLATLHRQLINATPPITAVRTSLKLEPTTRLSGSLSSSMQSLSFGQTRPTDRKGKGKAEAHIDVIARGGMEWIKIWSKRESHLRTEFREMDSYINSDWSESDDDEGAVGSGSTSGGTARPLKNSLIEIADQLLYIAERIERPPGCGVPKITIRLTRMEENPEGGHLDDRIPRTFEVLRSKGIHLEFGDLGHVPIRGHRIERFSAGRPSLKINLDPTSLVGLCSDIMHHPLPADDAEAQRRFLRPKEVALAQGRPADKLQSKNSRELYKEVLEEMRSPLIEHIRDTLQASLDAASKDGQEVQRPEFWASKEAVRHLREAMCSKEVIGQGMEQRRMRRLVGAEAGDFFEGSRYEGKAGCLQGIKVNVLPDDLPGQSDRSPMCAEGMRSFHRSLSTISGQFLRDYYAALSDPSTANETLPFFLRPDKLPVPKIAQLSLAFPIVTLHAFHRGAAEGMTTLCFGNVTFRDLFSTPRWRLKGFAQSNYEDEFARLHAEGVARDGTPSREKIEGHAAVWMLPYRSFAEGKRVRFEKGDYSYPQPV